MSCTDIPTWIIEKNTVLSPDKEIEIRDILKDRVIFIEYNQYYKGIDIPKYTNYVSIGSLGFMYHIDRLEYYQKGYGPDCYWKGYNSIPSAMYGDFGKYLWNSDYLILSVGEIKRRYKDIIRYFNTEELFFRPLSNRKCFTGQKLNIENLKNFPQFFFDFCQISAYDPPFAEFRFFCERHKGPFAGSSYTINGEMGIFQDAYTEHTPYFSMARGYAANFASVPQHDLNPIYVLDIGISKDLKKIGIVEFNGAYCSGWYDSNINDMVNNFDRIVIEQSLLLEENN